MHKKHLFALLFICLLVAFIGCRSKYQKVLKGDDPELKLKSAKEYYASGDYFRAMPLFQELVNVYRGSDEAELIAYQYADCNFKLKDYLTARYYFKAFAETYPRSKYTEEALFKAAFCYYQESPTHSLDQSSTNKAIESFILFANMYPNSGKIDSCNTLLDKLREKLVEKSYDNAKIYFKTQKYKAAIVALSNAISDYPDSKHVEEMYFLRLKSAYEYARNSVEKKQAERFDQVVTLHQEFVDAFPQSNFLQESGDMNETSLKYLEKNKKTTATIK